MEAKRVYVIIMKLRSRKLIGTIATVLWLIIYALFMMMIGGLLVLGRGMILELLFYIVGGVAWLPVAMIIIKWMSKPDLINPH